MAGPPVRAADEIGKEGSDVAWGGAGSGKGRAAPRYPRNEGGEKEGDEGPESRRTNQGYGRREFFTDADTATAVLFRACVRTSFTLLL
mmetsp:Transcript_15/g.49  ORF Transcript_15/g.49 Transcript_15/m.49 type:complete len:88 (-) Transcript_15:523-786(-)